MFIVSERRKNTVNTIITKYLHIMYHRHTLSTINIETYHEYKLPYHNNMYIYLYVVDSTYQRKVAEVRGEGAEPWNLAVGGRGEGEGPELTKT